MYHHICDCTIDLSGDSSIQYSGPAGLSFCKSGRIISSNNKLRSTTPSEIMYLVLPSTAGGIAVARPLASLDQIGAGIVNYPQLAASRESK